MDRLWTILKANTLLMAGVTGAVLVVAGYQLLKQGTIDHTVLDAVALVAGYWIGLITPAPKQIKDDE